MITRRDNVRPLPTAERPREDLQVEALLRGFARLLMRRVEVRAGVRESVGSDVETRLKCELATLFDDGVQHELVDALVYAAAAGVSILWTAVHDSGADEDGPATALRATGQWKRFLEDFRVTASDSDAGEFDAEIVTFPRGGRPR